MNVRLPWVYGILHIQQLGLIRQVARPETTIEATVANYKAPGVRGKVVLPSDSTIPRILVVEKRPTGHPDFTHIIRATRSQLTAHNDVLDLRQSEWLAHPDAGTTTQHRGQSKGSNAENLRAMVESWSGAFTYTTEDVDRSVMLRMQPRTAFATPYVSAVVWLGYEYR